MARAAKIALNVEEVPAIADRGYFSDAEILTCHEDGITATVPRPHTHRILTPNEVYEKKQNQ
jgi:hypothetical protein